MIVIPRYGSSGRSPLICHIVDCTLIPEHGDIYVGRYPRHSYVVDYSVAVYIVGPGYRALRTHVVVTVAHEIYIAGVTFTLICYSWVLPFTLRRWSLHLIYDLHLVTFWLTRCWAVVTRLDGPHIYSYLGLFPL